ncbi:MAG: HAMP domain-containing protein, partial [Planctomycetota bacterium]
MIFRWISIGTRVALATSVPLILLAYVEHTVIEQRVQVTLHDSHRVMTEIVAKQLVTRIRLDLELEDETRIRNAVAELARELGDLERVKIELQSGETYLDWQRAVHRKDGPAPAELVVRGQSEPLGRLWLWLDDARLREIALGVQRHVHLFLFAGVLLTIGICLVVGAWLRRCFSELSQAMGRIEAGDWGVRVPEGSGEIGRVGEAFNNMIATMRAAE